MKKFLATGKGKLIAGLGALVLLCVVCFCAFLLYTQTPAVQANLHATATAESIALAGTTAKRVTPTLTKTVPLIVTQTITPLAYDLSIPPRRKYNHTYVIETTYDRFKDETTVGLKYKDPELNQRNGHIAISGSYVYQTQQPNPPRFADPAQAVEFFKALDLALADPRADHYLVNQLLRETYRVVRVKNGKLEPELHHDIAALLGVLQ